MTAEPVDYRDLFESVMSQQEKHIFGGTPVEILSVEQLRKSLKTSKSAPDEKKCPPLSNWVDQAGTASNQHPHCDICNITVSGVLQLHAHLAGKPHLKALRRRSEALGNPAASAQVATVQTGPGSSASDLPSGPLSVPSGVVNDFTKALEDHWLLSGGHYCRDCVVSCPSADALEQHLLGKRHLSRVGMKNTTEGQSSILCDLCNVSVQFEFQYDDHIRGKRHQKAVALLQLPFII
eukprot:Plantae.Rhodophyta-Purpureofilum_apyrenoidigerum.ctg12435.p1 GENE.Plantae.Rhodophyta-Purpureofilum_apyrenoidigerum.ctg12435~~Plantae.Rhodophyta-Purpureofilum_apyrenoidigerum.ctg12435.p1  ORF type:complete len:236 (-),score=25.69 Plantae.Rhodophyta-Purpureofilum_apyrenoidigerum.ctg12435:417-1124(-)